MINQEDNLEEIAEVIQELLTENREWWDGLTEGLPIYAERLYGKAEADRA